MQDIDTKLDEQQQQKAAETRLQRIKRGFSEFLGKAFDSFQTKVKNLFNAAEKLVTRTNEFERASPADLRAHLDFHNKSATSTLVLDSRTPLGSSLHQKFEVIAIKGEPLRAMVGGVDIAFSRWDTVAHNNPPVREKTIPPLRTVAGVKNPIQDPLRAITGWIDRHVLIEGPAAVDVGNTFVQRYSDPAPLNSFPNVWPFNRHRSDNNPKPRDVMPAQAELPDGTVDVQLLRTAPRGFFHPTIEGAKKGHPFHQPWAFAPNGENTVLTGILKALANARNYIYIEVSIGSN